MPPPPGVTPVSAASVQDELRRTFRRGLGASRAVAKFKKPLKQQGLKKNDEEKATSNNSGKTSNNGRVASALLDAGGLAALPAVAEGQEDVCVGGRAEKAGDNNHASSPLEMETRGRNATAEITAAAKDQPATSPSSQMAQDDLPPLGGFRRPELKEGEALKTAEDVFVVNGRAGDTSNVSADDVTRENKGIVELPRPVGNVASAAAAPEELPIVREHVALSPEMTVQIISAPSEAKLDPRGRLELTQEEQVTARSGLPPPGKKEEEEEEERAMMEGANSAAVSEISEEREAGAEFAARVFVLDERKPRPQPQPPSTTTTEDTEVDEKERRRRDGDLVCGRDSENGNEEGGKAMKGDKIVVKEYDGGRSQGEERKAAIERVHVGSSNFSQSKSANASVDEEMAPRRQADPALEETHNTMQKEAGKDFTVTRRSKKTYGGRDEAVTRPRSHYEGTPIERRPSQRKSSFLLPRTLMESTETTGIMREGNKMGQAGRADSHYGAANVSVVAGERAPDIDWGSKPVVHVCWPDQGDREERVSKHKTSTDAVESSLADEGDLQGLADGENVEQGAGGKVRLRDYPWQKKRDRDGSCKRHSKCHCYLFALDTLGYYALT